MSGAFTRTTRVGIGDYGTLFVTIKWDGRRLSMTGVEGPKSNGDCRGSCGQCVEAIDRLHSLCDGYDEATIAKLREIWERWHLNDMRAGCEHQRQTDTTRKVEVVSYKLTSEALRLRDQTLKAAAQAALRGEAFQPSLTARALAELEKWYADVFTPPDADSPLSGCYEVAKREQKGIGWVYPHEHPEGMLCKPCDVCGYKYGSEWRFEHVPVDVVEWLETLPDSGTDDWGRRIA